MMRLGPYFVFRCMLNGRGRDKAESQLLNLLRRRGQLAGNSGLTSNRQQ
ncbi:hypothetical protein [Paenibacillus sp. KR2-11]